ncbi:hypothetical protein FPQ18DRAFT_382653 [Pyronema domesticum]|nr:hypothetical protein FPQ18DRAFT_382653 [Pyronema domesticum]
MKLLYIIIPLIVAVAAISDPAPDADPESLQARVHELTESRIRTVINVADTTVTAAEGTIATTTDVVGGTKDHDFSEQGVVGIHEIEETLGFKIGGILGRKSLDDWND